MFNGLVFPVIFVLSGFGFRIAERYWPLRRFPEGPALCLDVVALVWAGVLTVAYGMLIAPLIIAGLRSLPFVQHSIRATEAPQSIAVALSAIVVVDFLNYWTHRLNHTRGLWATHAFHHSPQTMYWLAGVRESPIHYLLVTAPSTTVATLLPPETMIAWLLGLLVGPVLNQHFIHSNIDIRPGLFAKVFVTPNYHFVHHTADPRLGNLNFGFIFTFWDRLFGTYVDPSTVESDMPLGLTYPVNTARLMLGLRPSGNVGAERA